MTTPLTPTESEPAAAARAPGGSPCPRSILTDAGRAIADAEGPQELLDGLAGSMSSYAADTYILARVCEGGDAIEVVAAWDAGGAPTLDRGARSPLAAHNAADLLRTGAPFVSDDCASDPRLGEEDRRDLAAGGVGSLGLYPLVQRGDLFGVLSVRRRAPHAHSSTEIDLMSSIAALTGIAMRSLDSQAELAKQIKRANAIYRASRALSASPDEASLLRDAAQLMIDEIGFVGAWIGLVDREAEVLREGAMSGPGAYPGRPPTEYPLSRRGVASVEVVHTGQPVIHLDALRRAEAEGWGNIARAAGLRSFVTVPLKAGDKVLGAMGVGRQEARISEDELTILAMFGSQLATTLLRLRADAEQQRQVTALEEANAAQTKLLATVRELSTPVIPVHDGILVLPLVGTLDAVRSAQVTEALLHAIQKDRASVVILDITGVPAVDAGVADHLVGSTRAAALLGARCVLVGMSPAVASALVELGVELGEVVTRNNLQAGISYALALMSLQIRPLSAPLRASEPSAAAAARSRRSPRPRK